MLHPRFPFSVDKVELNVFLYKLMVMRRRDRSYQVSLQHVVPIQSVEPRVALSRL